jgi:hypothetical protein
MTDLDITPQHENSAMEEMNALLRHCNLFTAASGGVSRMMDVESLERLKFVRRQPPAIPMYPGTLISAQATPRTSPPHEEVANVYGRADR